MSRQALIEITTGRVINVIELENTSIWRVPVGHMLIESDIAGPGDTWDGRDFIIPTPPPPDPDVVELRELGGKVGGDIATLSEIRRYLALRDGL